MMGKIDKDVGTPITNFGIETEKLSEVGGGGVFRENENFHHPFNNPKSNYMH